MHLEVLNKEYRCLVAEGPLWDEREEKLLFLDVLGECIFITDIDGSRIEKIDVGQQIGCMALCENGDLLLAMEDGVYRMDKSRSMTLAHQPVKIKGRRFNDGKAGPDGSFYLGTSDADGKGAFYRLRDGVLTELFDGCSCSNGLDWTVDCTKMFYCDTPKRKIEVFDFDCESGTLSNRRTFADVPEQLGNPDGFAMDCEDNIWLGLWDGSAVVKLNTANGRLEDRLETPARKASCCCFAGKELDRLVITTASKEDAVDYPLSGCVFVTESPVKGKVSFRYKY